MTCISIFIQFKSTFNFQSGLTSSQRADGECVDVSVASKQSGVFVCSYIPSSLSKHTIAVSWGGVMVPGSPFIVSTYIDLNRQQ